MAVHVELQPVGREERPHILHSIDAAAGGMFEGTPKLEEGEDHMRVE